MITASTAGSRSAPAMACTGSPGSSFCRVKTNSETRISVGMALSRRRRMKVSMATPRGRGGYTQGAGSFEGDVVQANQAIGIGHETGQVAAHGDDSWVEVQVTGRHIVGQQAQGLEIQGLTLRLIVHGARLVQQLVEFRVAEVSVVLAALAGHELMNVTVRIRPPGPGAHADLEIARLLFAEQRGVLGGDQVDLETGFFGHGLNDLAD